MHVLGRVVLQERDLYQVVTEQGDYSASVSGKFRYEAERPSDYPAVGDFVLLQCVNKNDIAVIHKVLPRKSVFLRKAAGTNSVEQIVAANIDTVFICMSLNNDFNVRRLERYLSVAWNSGAMPVIVLTKVDLCDEVDAKVLEIENIAIGVPIIETSVVDKDGLSQIYQYLKEYHTVAFVGSSGVGKSTLIKQLQLKGTEKILDLACGFGRHSLEFARRGYDVTGIDITPAYIDYANEQAKEESLNAKFFCQDIRTITFDKEFDVVLNMADGAIGYLEDDEENHKIFSVIAKALKKGGKHFMDIMNGSYAETHFPYKLWDAGEKGLTLSAFEWEKDRKTLIYGQVDYMYGEALYKPEMKEGNPIRLYSLDEITEIFCKLGLRICNSFADFSGKPSSDNDIQLMVYSIRE